MGVERDAEPRRRRFAEQECGAGGRIHFHAMVHFDDLDVEALPERFGGLPRQRRQQVDPEAHVARADDGGMARGRGQLGEIVGAEPRGPDDVDDACLRCQPGQVHARRGAGKVQDPVGLDDERQGVVRDGDSGAAAACQQTGILAERGRASAFESAAQGDARRLRDQPYQGAPHAPGRADNHQPHVGSHVDVPLEQNALIACSL